jgi:AcrR family transcriptional regulator
LLSPHYCCVSKFMYSRRMSTQTGLRERKKAATRATLSQVAMQLALEVGVENVTAEAIAAAADVAPRTFHNYFASKEEAIVAVMVDRARGFANALRARPAGEPVWDALHHAIVAELSGPPEVMAEFLAQMRMLKASRSLRAHHLTIYEEVDHLLLSAIAERTGSDVDRDMYPRLLAAVAAAALKTAVEAWAEDDDRDPSPVALATDALRQLRAGLPEPITR